MPGVAAKPTRPLESLARGERAAVERIPDQFEHEPGFLQYLDQQGLRPGTTLRVIERRPDAIVVEVAGAKRRVRADCGVKVWVRPAAQV